MDHEDDGIGPDFLPDEGAEVGSADKPSLDWLSTPDFPEAEALPSWLPSDLPDLTLQADAVAPPWIAEPPPALLEPPTRIEPPNSPEAPPLEQPPVPIAAVEPQQTPGDIEPEEPPTAISPSALRALQADSEELSSRESEPLAPLPAPGGSTPNVLVERIAPVGKGVRQLIYGIVARNMGGHSVTKIEVEHTLPAGVRYLGSEPPAQVRDGRLYWQLANVPSGATQPIKIRIAPTRPGQALPEGLAVFKTSYTSQAEVTAPLSRPIVRLTWTGPQTVQVGDVANIQLRIANTGNAVATELVACHQTLSAQLLGDIVSTAIGTLAPGESVRLSLNVEVTRPGSHAIEAWLIGDALTAGPEKVTFEATQPVLDLHLSGPSNCRTPEDVEYHVEVSNPGTAAATNVRLVHSIPDGMEFVEAGNGGSYHAAEHAISWKLAALSPSQVRVFVVGLKAVTPGDFMHRIAARADRGLQAGLDAAVSNELEAAGHRLLDQLFDEPQEVADDRAISPDPAWRGATSAASGRARADQHIVFQLAGNSYAVPIDNVSEIGRLPRVTPVPNVPDWLLGLVNVRGDIVSLVDLRDFLGMGRSSLNSLSRMLVVRARAEDLTAGLVVDEVKGIQFIPAERICAPDLSSDDPIVTYLRGVVDADGKLMVVLDLDRLLLSAEMKQFETA